MKRLRRLDAFLNTVESALLVFFLSVMVILAFLQVVLRNVFSEGLLWADILLRHILLWLGFLGAAIATSEHRHINIDAVRRFLPPRVRSAVEVVTDLFAAAICGFLARASANFVRDEITSRDMFLAGIPAWYAQIIIPVGFTLLVVHFLIRAGLRTGAVGSGEAPE